MKVLYINTRFLGGGAEKVARQLFYGLKKRNIETYFLVGTGKQINFDYEVIHSKIIEKSYNYVICKLKNNAIPQNLYAKNKIIEFIIRNKIDIVHFHNIHGNYIGIKDLEEIQKYCKVVWTLHDMWVLTGHCAYSLNCEKWINEKCNKCDNLRLYPKMYYDSANKLFLLKEQNFLKRNIIFVSPSNWLKTICKKSYLKDQDINIINNGVNTIEFRVIKKRLLREKYNIPIDKNILLFSAGNIYNPYKGVGILIEALKILNDKEKYLLAIVGNGEIEELKLDFEIWKIGRIDDDKKMNEIYAVSDVFIMPSVAENFPCSILESFASATPVIASDVGGIGEEVTKETGWLIKNLEKRTICDTIETAFADKEKLTYMGIQCRKRAETHFSEEKMLDEYYNLYNNL